MQVAGAHILMLGSYVDYEAGSEQYEWLVRDLERVDRQRTPWLIAVLHVPWYSSNMHHHGEGDDIMVRIAAPCSDPCFTRVARLRPSRCFRVVESWLSARVKTGAPTWRRKDCFEFAVR